MCLLIHRPIGADVPTEWLDNAQTANPDGWGIMASDGVKIIVRRGLNRKKFRTALKTYKGMDTFIHFRNATHGSVSQENCHPFGIPGFAIMHNGVIPIDCRSDPDRPDTWHYATSILAPMLAHDRNALADPKFVEVIGKHVGIGNKLAILRTDGQHAIINRNHGQEINGCWYSNVWSLESPWEGWNTWDLDDLRSLSREELIELCTHEPEAIADSILDSRSRRFAWDCR